MEFAHTREAAFLRLEEFEKKASRYSSQRNHVMPGHTNVSRLSPAIRHRLITEKEIFEGITKRYAFSTVQKYVQEVYWRRYWKSWLALRPSVWTDYLRDLSEIDPCGQALDVMAGEGPVDVMNDFVRELKETGYMHNHARMWFAGYWIHTMKLPWQLGADFFYRHLLDADPASNTLSWRWVAGIQTPGKSYLARRSNIEKYLDPERLDTHADGLEFLENGKAAQLEIPARPKTVLPERGESTMNNEKRTGLLVHEDDLSVETVFPNLPIASSLLVELNCCASEVKREWMTKAFDDAASRMPGLVLRASFSRKSLVEWVENQKLEQIIAARPEVGVVNDRLEEMTKDLGIEIIYRDRVEDLEFLPFAKSGFFGFWKKIEPLLKGRLEG